MAVEVTGATKELLEQRNRRQAAGAAAAEQKRGNRHKAGDGDRHRVVRRVAKSRTQEVAAVHEVKRGPQKRWRRAYALPYLPDPPGFVLCWISRHNQFRGDEAGLIAAIQEGWAFARKEDFPDDTLPTQRLTDHGEIVGNAVSVLMKLPEEFKAQRDAYYNSRRDSATQEANRAKPGLKEANPKMPLVEDLNQQESEFVRARRRVRSAG